MPTHNQRTFGGFPAPVMDADEPFFVELPAEDATPAEVERPSWFQKSPQPEPALPQRPPKRPTIDQRGKSQKLRIETASEEGEVLAWTDRFVNWVQSEGGTGYGISIVVHVIALLVMSLWMFVIPNNEELITTIETTEVVDLASVQDATIVDLNTEFPEQAKVPEFDPMPMAAPDLGVGFLSEALSQTKGGGVELKVPSKAVTKGSFTVWTVPDDPQPGQQYIIMIQVKLKNELKRYPRRDLKGNIIGTDGYRDFFGGPGDSGYLPVKDNVVQVEACIVPGAAQLVKDTITVESKILNEKQVIDIVF